MFKAHESINIKLTVMRKLMMSVAVFIVLFVIADTSFRIYARSIMQPDPASILFEDNNLVNAKWHKKNSSAIVTYRGTPPHLVSFDSNGFRGTNNASLKHPNGIVRIMTLGGSSTEDAFVGDDETWPTRMQYYLNQSLGTNCCEVLNLGCSGYTTLRCVTNLIVNGLQFEPDIVIFYNANNDFFKGFLAKDGIKFVETHVDYEARKTTWLSRLMCKSIILNRINRHIYYMNRKKNHDYLAKYWDLPDDSKADVDITNIENDTVTGLKKLHELSVSNGFVPVIGIQATLMKYDLNHDELLCMWEVLRWEYRDRPIKWKVYVDGINRIKTAEKRYAAEADIICLDIEKGVQKSTSNFIDHIHSTPRGCDEIGKSFAIELLWSERIQKVIRSHIVKGINERDNR